MQFAEAEAYFTPCTNDNTVNNRLVCAHLLLKRNYIYCVQPHWWRHYAKFCTCYWANTVMFVQSEPLYVPMKFQDVPSEHSDYLIHDCESCEYRVKLHFCLVRDFTVLQVVAGFLY